MISLQVTFELTVISMLNFQVDKWFEDAAEAPRLQGDLVVLRTVIQSFHSHRRGMRKSDRRCPQTKPQTL